MNLATTVVDGVRYALFIAAFRGLPFVVFAMFSPNIGGRGKVCAVLVQAGLLTAVPMLGGDVRALPIVVGSAYYLALGCAAPYGVKALEERWVTRGGLFTVLFATCLLFPALVAPGIAGSTFLVLGWELLLSAYSYCVDVAGSRERPRLSSCLFFLFVNPTVTYSNRGRAVGPPRFDARAVGRILLGLTALFASGFLLRVARAVLPLHEERGAIASAVLFGFTQVLALYAAHSGLASVQIGLMRKLGHSLPERYRWPLLAENPLDFWRRWNTYLGSWLEKYVFVPAARRLWHASFGKGTKAAALVATFGVSGLLHDGFSYASALSLSTRGLQLFLASSIVVLTWVGVASYSASRKGARSSTRSRTLYAAMSRLCVLCWLTLSAMAWG